MSKYIERDALITYIKEQKRVAKLALIKQVEEMPAVDMEPRPTGLWEPCEEHPGYLNCSHCKDCVIEPDWPTDERWRFCPSCGSENRKAASQDEGREGVPHENE